MVSIYDADTHRLTVATTPTRRMYKEDGLKGGHVIMLGPGCEEAAFAALQAYPQGLQIGGKCVKACVLPVVVRVVCHQYVCSGIPIPPLDAFGGCVACF